LKLIFDLF